MKAGAANILSWFDLQKQEGLNQSKSKSKHIIIACVCLCVFVCVCAARQVHDWLLVSAPFYVS